MLLNREFFRKYSPPERAAFESMLAPSHSDELALHLELLAAPLFLLVCKTARIC
jgi:hypothetical protein